MSHSALTGFPASHEAARPSCDVLEDWDSLLTALTERLRSTVRGLPGDEAPLVTEWQLVRSVVLECAADLRRLHVAWHAENSRRRKMEIGLHRSDEVAIHAIVDLNSSLHPANRAGGEAGEEKAPPTTI